MSKVAIIDIDGVISNSEARFAKAEEAKAAWPDDGMHEPGESAIGLYWRTAFTPDLVRLDTLIDGVPEALEQIRQAGYVLYFLTSRPESMRQATVDWFWSFVSDFMIFPHESHNQLIMKPASQQFVKTVTWKAGVVELLVRLFGVEELLFVDDEPAIHESVAALSLPCRCKVTSDLQHALAMLEEKR